jgi:hypothetical protein
MHDGFMQRGACVDHRGIVSCAVVSWLRRLNLAVSLIGGSSLLEPRESSRGEVNRHFNFQQRSGRSPGTFANAQQATPAFCAVVTRYDSVNLNHRA